MPRILLFGILIIYHIYSGMRHNDIDHGLVGATSYLTVYLFPDILSQYRGIAVGKKAVPAFGIIFAFVFLCAFVDVFMIENHLLEAKIVFDVLVDGVVTFAIGVAIDIVPPTDRSKKSIISDAIRKIVEKVARIYGSPTPQPTRA